MSNERNRPTVRSRADHRELRLRLGRLDPLAVPKTAALMAKLGIDEDAIRRVPYATPLRLMVYPVK